MQSRGATPLAMVEARSLAIATLIHQQLEAAGQPCGQYHPLGRMLEPNNRLSVACEAASHDTCHVGPVNTGPGRTWRCHCLCHQARSLQVVR